jgi:hypothetical protein
VTGETAGGRYLCDRMPGPARAGQPGSGHAQSFLAYQVTRGRAGVLQDVLDIAARPAERPCDAGDVDVGIIGVTVDVPSDVRLDRSPLRDRRRVRGTLREQADQVEQLLAGYMKPGRISPADDACSTRPAPAIGTRSSYVPRGSDRMCRVPRLIAIYTAAQDDGE